MHRTDAKVTGTAGAKPVASSAPDLARVLFEVNPSLEACTCIRKKPSLKFRNSHTTRDRVGSSILGFLGPSTQSN